MWRITRKTLTLSQDWNSNFYHVVKYIQTEQGWKYYLMLQMFMVHLGLDL